MGRFDLVVGTAVILLSLSFSTAPIVSCRRRIRRIARLERATARDIMRELHGRG
jgi:hypothetical protein